MRINTSRPSVSLCESAAPPCEVKAVKADVFEAEDGHDTVRRYAKEGALLGLKIGCGATLIGIPFATHLAKSEGKGRKARRAKRQLPLYGVIGFPSFVVGGLGAGVGAVCGAATGVFKLNRKKR